MSMTTPWWKMTVHILPQKWLITCTHPSTHSSEQVNAYLHPLHGLEWMYPLHSQVHRRVWLHSVTYSAEDSVHWCNHSAEGSDYIFNGSAEGEGLHLGVGQTISNLFQPTLLTPAHSAHSSPLQLIPHHPNLFPAYSGHPLIPTYSSPYHPSHNPSPSQPISSQFQTTLLIPPHPTAERLDGSKGVGRFISQPRRQDRSKNWLQQADWDNAMMLGWWEQQGARSTKNSRVEWVQVEQAGDWGSTLGMGKVNWIIFQGRYTEAFYTG